MTTPRRKIVALIASAVVVAGGAAIAIAQWPRGAGTSGTAGGGAETGKPAEVQHVASAEGSTVSGAPVAPPKVVALRPPDETLDPAFWLDVLEPEKVHDALAGNAWVKETAAQPLGRGFLGPWAVFFGTRGQDVGGRFDGMVLDLFTSALLADPYRVVWLAGEKNAHAPVVVVPEASSKAASVLETLIAAAGKGGFAPQGCPGSAASREEPPKEEERAQASADAAAAPPPQAAEGLAVIHRLVFADHALFAAHAGKRLVISMRPDAVLHGMCLTPFELQRNGNAVELGVDLHQNGRALQGLTALLGLDHQAKLAMALQGDGFAPTGLVAGLANPGHLAAGPLDPSMLKLVPVGTGLFVALNLKLPAQLDAASLEAALAGKKLSGKPVTRQVIVLWNPRGEFRLHNEVAVIWSRAEDEAFLASVLSQKHPLEMAKWCDHVVLASSEGLLKDIEASCKGSSPSVLSAAPAIAKRLQEPTSLGVHVNLGEVLSQLTMDGWASESKPLPKADAKPAMVPTPPEIDAARKQLEALPTLHWRAVVDDKGQLTPGGFRS